MQLWFAPVSIKWCEASCMRFNENYVFFCLFRFHYCQEWLFYFRIFWFIVNKYGISTSAQSFSLEGTGHIRHIRWRVMQKKCFHNTFATYLCIDMSKKKKTQWECQNVYMIFKCFFFQIHDQYLLRYISHNSRCYGNAAWSVPSNSTPNSTTFCWQTADWHLSF